jgi:hypothetical protein
MLDRAYFLSEDQLLDVKLHKQCAKLVFDVGAWVGLMRAAIRLCERVHDATSMKIMVSVPGQWFSYQSILRRGMTFSQIEDYLRGFGRNREDQRVVRQHWSTTSRVQVSTAVEHNVNE